jgi:UDP-N-acetylmuramyl pentapeptide phosphotransferase/UDP-N-acetylglucosamine-1-phosphate transferase
VAAPVTAVLLGVAAGFLAAQLIWRMSAGLFASVVLQRPNYRSHYLPTGAGIVLALAVATVEGGRALVASAGVGPVAGPGVARTVMLAGLFGFGALGFVDDVLGGDAERGWRAHLRALAAGRLSAGGVKLLGGGVLALTLVSAAGSAASGSGGVLRVAADGALVALAANLGNAFDRAPGRTIKVSLVAWLPLAVAAGGSAAGVALGPVIGAAVGLLPEDLGERLMLGDAGANALGAALGLGAVLTLGPGARLVTAGVLVVLNVAADVVSFSRVIKNTPALDRLDRLGRLRLS